MTICTSSRLLVSLYMKLRYLSLLLVPICLSGCAVVAPGGYVDDGYSGDYYGYPGYYGGVYYGGSGYSRGGYYHHHNSGGYAHSSARGGSFHSTAVSHGSGNPQRGGSRQLGRRPYRRRSLRRRRKHGGSGGHH